MRYIAMCIVLAAIIGISLTACEATPTDDGGWRITPATNQPPRTIPGRRVRQIEYKGHCLASAGGKCWPCNGGEVRDCDEWFQIIDDLAGGTQQQSQQTLSVLYTDNETGDVHETVINIDPLSLTGTSGSRIIQAAPIVPSPTPTPWPGELPGSDTSELVSIITFMLASDGVAWNREQILLAYNLIDPLPVPFEYRASLLGFNTASESIDIVVIAREDQDLPRSTNDGLDVMVLPLGELGLDDPGPVALRIKGPIGVFAQQAELLFPIGTSVDFNNSYGSWRLEAIEGPNAEYLLELRLGGAVVGTW